MNVSLSLIVALAIFGTSAAYVPQKAVPIKDDDAGKCVYNGEVIAEGQHFLSGCLEVNCFKDGTLKVGSCLPMRVESSCKAGEFLNRTLPYPKCCVRTYTCETKNGVHVIQA